jgi:F1F0 ATPase subunit 2
MDEQPMSLLSFGRLPAWAMALSLAAHLAAGLGLGFFHFGALWRAARLLTGGGRATPAIAVLIGRWVLLGGLLALASLEGAPPLLAMALGVLLARSRVLRRVREAAP